MSSFVEVVKSLKENKKSQDDGFNRLEAAVSGGEISKSGKEEKEKEKTNKEKKEMGYLASIASGIIESNKLLDEGFKGMLKSKTGFLGGIAGLLIGPIGMLGAFLKELGIAIVTLTKFYGKGFKILTSPFVAFFKLLSRIGKAFMGIKAESVLVKSLQNVAKIIKLFNITIPLFLLRLTGIPKIFTSLLDLFKAMKDSFKTTILVSLKNGVKNVKSFFASIGAALTSFKELAKFGLNFDKLKDSTKGLNTFQKAIVGFFKSVGNIFNPIIKSVKDVMTVIKGATGGGGSTFMKIFNAVRGFFKTIGSVLGKIFVPITIIMSLFDFVTGFMEGYKKDGIMGGFKIGITKLFNGLVSMPLDLLKDLLSWALSKLGFENASEALDKFSFKKFFTDIIAKIFDGIEGVVKYIKGLFSFPKDGGPLAVFQKLVDIIFAPMDIAVNFIRGLFGFDVGKDGKKLPPFKMSEFLGSAIKMISDKIIEFFSFLVGGLEKFVRKTLGETVGDSIFGERKLKEVKPSMAVDDFSSGKASATKDKTINLDAFAKGSIGDENARFRTMGGGIGGAFDKLLKESLGKKNPDSNLMMVDDVSTAREFAFKENALEKSISGGGATTLIQTKNEADNRIITNNGGGGSPIIASVNPDTVISRATSYAT